MPGSVASDLRGVPPAPDPAQLDRLAALVAPLSRVLQPKLYGVDRLREPMLLVGNHTLYGLLDVPFLIAELWTRRRTVVRGLGDHRHYAIPVWREMLESGGMVRGTRDNVRALMREGENILVFPGGSEEVFKQRGERYTLKWKERVGFAKLAIEAGYPVVPFAAVGVEEMFDVVLDNRTPGISRASELTKRLVGMPLPRWASASGLWSRGRSGSTSGSASRSTPAPSAAAATRRSGRCATGRAPRSRAASGCCGRSATPTRTGDWRRGCCTGTPRQTPRGMTRGRPS